MAMKYRSKYRNNGDILYYDKHSDSENENEIPLQAVKKVTPTLEIEIKPNDTLQAIALKFHCTTAELKRLNNIMRENEIYAKKTIKVPVQPHSLLTEGIVGVHISGNCSPTQVTEISRINSIDTETLKEKLENSKEISNENQFKQFNSSDLPVINDLIYNSTIQNLECNTEEFIDDGDDVKLLPSTPVTTVNQLSFRGDDCGLSWLGLLIFIIIIGVACPLIYVFYIAEHPEKFHHHHL